MPQYLTTCSVLKAASLHWHSLQTSGEAPKENKTRHFQQLSHQVSQTSRGKLYMQVCAGSHIHCYQRKESQEWSVIIGW